jgi:NAD(P)-dependent dehydrogenase (short-subunit alcohol dehydrogenase family)
MNAGTGVTGNSVLPGPTRSDGAETSLEAMARDNKTTPDAKAQTFVKEFRPTSLIQRFATVEEVANMVVYTCSKEASATNGAALRVEGGLLRSVA